MNIAKFLSATFLQDTSGPLLLKSVSIIILCFVLFGQIDIFSSENAMKTCLEAITRNSPGVFQISDLSRQRIPVVQKKSLFDKVIMIIATVQ